ncbi:hypothetical protein ACCO45_003638 [Purpureocillium lilacinum]|uniref:Uncharacterized protein n=1 Tax=Purpureocillium lilacinum TaxID=33203 RepID=A0ACC4E0E9_PURLI
MGGMSLSTASVNNIGRALAGPSEVERRPNIVGNFLDRPASSQWWAFYAGTAVELRHLSRAPGTCFVGSVEWWVTPERDRPKTPGTLDGTPSPWKAGDVPVGSACSAPSAPLVAQDLPLAPRRAGSRGQQR